MISKYPYTDFNEYNLDWCIKRIRDLTDEWAETHQEWLSVQHSWEEVQTEWANYKKYIDEYFENLDLSQEVSDKIDEMADAGYFSNLFISLFRDEVLGTAATTAGTYTAQWIADNLLQETGYVIDNSLSVQNAAADAKAAGDFIYDINEYLNDIKSELFIYTGPINLISDNSYTAGMLIDYTTGEVNSADAVYGTYDNFFAVSRLHGEKITLTYRNAPNSRIRVWFRTAFYDINHIFISGITGQDAATIPPRAAYCKISTYAAYPAAEASYKLMLEYTNSDLDIAADYSPYFQPYYIYRGLIGKNFDGMKLCVFGDSLAANGSGGTDTWIQMVGDALGFSAVYNRGVGGSRITPGGENIYCYVNAEGDCYNRLAYSTPQTPPSGYTEINANMDGVDRVNTIPADTDILIILAGANDVGNVSADGFTRGAEFPYTALR